MTRGWQKQCGVAATCLAMSFQYLDATGDRHSLNSTMVNEYVRETMGDEFTAKDFRTWQGTLEAAIVMSSLDPPRTKAGAQKRSAELLAKWRDGWEIVRPPAANFVSTLRSCRHLSKEHCLRTCGEVTPRHAEDYQKWKPK